MAYDVDFLKYDTNRLMLVDWSSLSYHQIWSMKSEKNREKYGLQDEEGELRIWKNKMILSLTDLIEKFNPKDIIIAIDANSWRKKYVKDYYDENAMVYYDDKYIYTEADNFAYRVSKLGDGVYDAVRIKPVNYSEFRNLENKRKLGELSEAKNKMLWDIFENGKRPIIPAYKGKRKVSDWPFVVEKSKWQKFKDDFGKEVAKYFRALAVQVDGAEGDDVLYCGVTSLADQYSSVILVTRDTDMAQISHPKLHIYDHVDDKFMSCADPVSYLTAKILHGDDSDNIQGMVFPDVKRPGLPKATQCGKKGADDLVATCPNIYEKAKLEGWDKQFIRNTNLIDLSKTPEEIKNAVKARFIMEGVERADVDGLSSFGITAKLIQMCKNYQLRNFYAFQPREAVIANPGMFNGEMMEQNRRASYNELNAPAAVQPNTTYEQVGNREFDSITVFDDPLSEFGNISDLL